MKTIKQEIADNKADWNSGAWPAMLLFLSVIAVSILLINL